MMNCHNNKVVLFVYIFSIVLIAAITAAAQDECAKLNEPCDDFPPNKHCCKGMVCSLSSDNFTSKGICHIDDTYLPKCRKPGQPCGDLDATPPTLFQDNILELSANTTCCDNMECDSSSRKCRISNLECRLEDQPCGSLDDNLLIDDYQKAFLSSNSFCCPGLSCGALGRCFNASEIECGAHGRCFDVSEIECIKEGKSCRVYGCCNGLHCNSVGRDRTGEFQYRCQKKTCQTTVSCDVFNNNCCDGYYCHNRFLLFGGFCTLDGN